MAHVHGDKKKMVEHVAHAAKGAMKGPGLHGSMMEHMMDMPHGPMNHGNMGGHIARGAVVSAGAKTGGSVMKRLARHPLLMFGLGVVAGVVVYKYRKQIIASAVEVGEKGRDFVLQQKENLEDIVASTQEPGEEES